MIVERAARLRDCNWLINPRPMRVPRLEDIRTVVLQQDVFTVIDVAPGLPVGDFLNPTAQPVIPICARERRRRVAGGKVLDLGQPILGIVRVLREAACSEQGLLDEVPIVIILVRVDRIRGQLVARVDHRPTRAIAHRIVREVLRRPQHRMTSGGQSIELVVAEALCAPSVR